MDWNTIANIVVFLVLPWFFPLLVAFCAYLYKRGIAALPVAQRAEAVRIVQMAVNAIEQAMGGSPGTVKRQQAIDVITSTLKAAKIVVPPDLIGIALEEAVHTLNTPPEVVASVPTPAPMPIDLVTTQSVPTAPVPVPISQLPTLTVPALAREAIAAPFDVHNFVLTNSGIPTAQ